MTKATITKEAGIFVLKILYNKPKPEELDDIRITYSTEEMTGSGRARGTRIIAVALPKLKSKGGQIYELLWEARSEITLPRVRKAGEWLGFLHDEVNRLLAAKPAVKLPASTTTPSRR